MQRVLVATLNKAQKDAKFSNSYSQFLIALIYLDNQTDLRSMMKLVFVCY